MHLKNFNINYQALKMIENICQELDYEWRNIFVILLH